MPPLPPVPDVLKVQIKGTTGGLYNWANVFHCDFGGGSPTIADCEAIADVVVSQWTANWAPVCPTSTKLKQVVVTDLTSNTSAEGTVDVDVAGTSSFDKIPANAAFLLSKLIEARYRGGHPRSYLFVGGDGHLQDDGHWSSSAVTTFTALWPALIDALITGSPYGSTNIGQESAVSYYTTDYTVTPHKRVRRDVPIVYGIPLDGYSGHAELASQRRRIGRKR